jgi:hypothetical protein
MSMRGVQRIAVSVLVGLGSLGVAGAVAGVVATPAGALAACTDSWVGPNTGVIDWNANATNWSTGFPGAGSVVCISEPGTYTVSLAGGASVNTLQVGGAAGSFPTVLVDPTGGSESLTLGAPSTIESGGTLTLDPTAVGNVSVNGGSGSLIVASGGSLTTESSFSNVFMAVPVTNQAGGNVTIGATSNQFNNGTLTTNDGTFTVTNAADINLTSGSSFTQEAGTLVVTGSFGENSGTFTASGGAETGNPVSFSGGTLADSATTGSFQGTATFNLTGTIPAGQTVTGNGVSGSLDIQLSAPVTVDGSLVFDPSAVGKVGVNGSSGSLTVASGGNLTTESSVSNSFIDVPVTNQTGGTVTIGGSSTQFNNGTLTTNDGTFSVTGGGNANLTSGSSFTQAAGTLAVTGSFTENSGTFTASGGAESGNPVTFSGGTLVDSATTGSFQGVATFNLTGTIPVGQTVTVNGVSGSLNAQLPGAVTVDGALVFVTSSVGNPGVNGSSGSLTVASGGNLTTQGSVSNVFIQVPVTNLAGGTVTVGSTSTQFNNGTLTTNDGTFTVQSGAGVTLSSGSSFTQAAGTLAVSGSFGENSGTFTASGGAESGNPVTFSGGTLADSATTGSFQGTSTFNLTGTVPVAQTVTVNGVGGSLDVQLPSAVTVDGNLVFVTSSVGNAGVNGSSGSLTVAAGGTLSTQGSVSNVFIDVPITNQAGGTVTLGAASNQANGGKPIANSGTLQVVNGGSLNLSSGSTLTNAAVGTIGVTVHGVNGGISGPGTTLVAGSTLSVTTVGSPSIGTVFTPIGGPVTGTFTNLSFGSAAYAVAYPAGAVQLTTEAPYTYTASPISAKENLSTGTVTLGTIGSASDGTGSYSATVNWGDGTGTGPAAVNVSGSTGTVTGSHTYTANGTYTVTSTLANTDGTTLTTSESVTVSGPVVTGFSKVTVVHGKKLTTKISGTGLDGSAVVTTSNPGVTVVSVKASKVSKKHPNPTLTLKLAVSKTAALGPFNVTITETGGATTVIGAITVT